MQRGRDGEAVGRQLQGRRDHLLEAHGAVPAEGGEPGVRRRRRHGAHHPVGHVAAVFTAEIVDGRLSRPATQAADFPGVPRLGVVDDDGRHAAKAGVLGKRHVDHHAGGHARVNGVASLLEDPVAGRSCQVVTGADHVRDAANQRAIASQSQCHSDLRAGNRVRNQHPSCLAAV